MAKSKYFRIAVAGPTIDGREIKPEWLEQMAANYDPATYTARINCEHIAGYSPDRPFNAYGSVLALKTEPVELTINGVKTASVGLYAQIDANDQLAEMVGRDQKVFTSCEVNDNFLGKGEAYLVGLAATDFPASIGTERLKFAAMARSNLFSSACETQIEIDAGVADSSGIAAAIVAGFSALAAKFTPGDEKAKEEPKTPPPANDNSFDVAAFSTALGEQVAAAIKPSTDAIAALQGEFAAIKTKLETTEKTDSFHRHPATGGGATVQTDC